MTKIDLFTKRYLKSFARKNNFVFPYNYKEKLEKVLQSYKHDNISVIFQHWWSLGCDNINASATLKGTIMFNAPWACKILFEWDSDVVRDAFKMTLFHEYAHQSNEYVDKCLFGKKAKVKNWINEVRADFFAMGNGFHGDKDLALKAMTYKLCNWEKDKNSFLHPSWEKRISYINYYRFDENLLRAIALDAGCPDENYIKLIANHYL